MTTIDPSSVTIRQIVELVLRGQIRIPEFQRGFVWDADAVAFFMDSLYRNYPVGSLLFWRTKEPLRSERRLGPFELQKKDPDYPWDYVLDGQQRITSIFGVFQTELEAKGDIDWTKIYFDFKADAGIQESQFLALKDADVNPDRHFPLNCLFDPIAYRKATNLLSDDDIPKIDELQATFKEIRIPIQLINTEDRAAVAIIFERINRAGVPLDTLQLLTAWTWSEEFALQERFNELSTELEPFGFKEVGSDINLLLRCCAALIAGDASPETLVGLDGAEVRSRFTEIVNGVKGAVDFLRDNLNVYSLENLPFSTILVPLSVFFAVPGTQQVIYTDEQRKQILRWFWRCCFSKRYSSGVLRNLKTDIAEMVKLKKSEHSSLGEFSANIGHEFFLINQFRAGVVNTNTFILMLANEKPLSFVSGSPISLREVLKDGNRNEFHHIYPRSFVQASEFTGFDVNCLANFCFLSRADNNFLGGVAPSIYRAKMPANLSEILERAFCPLTVFNNDFGDFIVERADMLMKKAHELIR